MTALSELRGSKWAGTAELWLDPLGDEVEKSECTISVEEGAVRYTWSREGKTHEGSVTLNDAGAVFTDTWHQPQPMQCRAVMPGQGLFQVQGQYGPEADWGWRIGVSLRGESGELVLQMTNITSWGEEVRAVRMICQKQS